MPFGRVRHENPAAGGYSKRRSVNQDAQRTVNLYLRLTRQSLNPGLRCTWFRVNGICRHRQWTDTGDDQPQSSGYRHLRKRGLSHKRDWRRDTHRNTITLGGTKRVALSANRNHVIAVTGQNAYIITGSNVTAVTDPILLAAISLIIWMAISFCHSRLHNSFYFRNQ